MPTPIEDYALIGDCETAALVARGGSIDWLCVPRFDSGACFAALLGAPEHGRWLLGPSDPPRAVRRRYREGTLILETEYETGEGVATVVDLMPIRSRAPELVRVVVGARGRVPMRMELVIRFDYGAVVPWVRRIEGGIRAVAGPNTLVLRAGVPLRGENLTTVADFAVEEGRSPMPPPAASWPRPPPRFRRSSAARGTGTTATAGSGTRPSRSTR